MQSQLTALSRGKHSELLAATALLANGYSVMEPIAPEPYDLVIRVPSTKETMYIQVKSAFSRNEKRYGGKYIVVRGHRSNGRVYTKDEVDLFAAVWQGKVYLFPNREISEYWVKPEDLEKRWEKLEV